ncbi:MAG: restriction endonuclease subunit S [Halobacteriota archaeon]|jgi:type I restriction enzyme S subunit
MTSWTTRKLGEIARIRRGASPRPKGDPRYFGGDIPWLKIGDVPPGSRFVSQTEEGVTRAGRDLSVYVEPGTLLLSNSASVGRPVITEVGACIHDGWLAIDGYESELRQDFLYWCLIWSHSQFQQLAPTGTQKNLNIGLVTGFEVAVPSLEDQKRIVELLDAADELRKLRANADRRTEAFLPALFDQMFGDPLKETSHSPSVPLGEIVDFGSGATPPKENPEFWNGMTPWVSPKDMKTKEITDAEDHVSTAAFEKTNLQLIPKDTVLIVVRGMILAHTVPIRICRVPVAINQDMKALLPTKQAIEPEYLRWSLQAQHAHLLNQVSTAGHGTKKLDSDKLRSVTIPLPPLHLQKRFATLVNEIGGLEAEQASSGHRLENFFHSLLDRAFRGEL